MLQPRPSVNNEEQTRSFFTAVSATRAAMVAVLWSVPLVIFVCTLPFGWKATWNALRIESFTPCFLDLRVITSGLTTVRKGGDPLVTNPFDPLGRTLNYPRIWLVLFSLLGISDRNVVLVGIVLCALFLACVSAMILECAEDYEALTILVSGSSLSSLFAIERGNIDLFIFTLVYLSCRLPGNKHWRSAFLAFAAVLKIYPIAGMLAGFAVSTARDKRVLAVLIGLVIAIFALQWHDILLIGRSTPVFGYSSFGVISIMQQAASYAARYSLTASMSKHFGYVVMSGCYLAAAVIVVVAWFRLDQLTRAIQTFSDRSAMFTVFGAIYVFCFALGSNWDYRLIFLIPTLPFVLLLGHQRQYRWWSIAYILLLVFSENSLALQIRYGLIFAHLASFAVFLFVLTVLTKQFKTVVAVSPKRRNQQEPEPCTS